MQQFRVVPIIISVVFLQACAGLVPINGNADLPVSSVDTLAPTLDNSEGEFDYGNLVYIDDLEVLMLESFPLQVYAVVKGNLPDGCTTIERHEVRRDGNSFVISIFTKRPKGAFCTEALVPFEYAVTLDVYGLPAGTYAIIAGDVSADFTFDMDNSPNISGGG